jgi:protein-L-isoaspartate(D-aspartate) O-methyltransferase
MAWRCSGKTNSELIHNMSKSGIFHSDRVSKVLFLSSPYFGVFTTARFEAMMLTDRVNYVIHKDSAYEDSPQLRQFYSQNFLAHQRRW